MDLEVVFLGLEEFIFRDLKQRVYEVSKVYIVGYGAMVLGLDEIFKRERIKYFVNYKLVRLKVIFNKIRKYIFKLFQIFRNGNEVYQLGLGYRELFVFSSFIYIGCQDVICGVDIVGQVVV